MDKYICTEDGMEKFEDGDWIKVEEVEQADIKSGIKQPMEGLLYDLDLMPEQIKSAINDLRREVVECQYRENERLKKEKDDLVLANKGRKALTGAQFSCMEKLEKEKEWLLNKCAKNECYIHNLWAPGKSEKEYKTILTDSMQQALKEK